MNIELHLQVISILMAVIAVALPALIAIVGFVYLRNIREKIDNVSALVDELWERMNASRP